MSKMISVNYEYIINCDKLIEVDDDFDVDDYDNYHEIDLPNDEVIITINKKNYDCKFVGISSVIEV